MNDRIKAAIKQASHTLYPYCNISPEKAQEVVYELFDLCRALSNHADEIAKVASSNRGMCDAQQVLIDELREQNAIQAEQLDRLADAVPSAGAHADRVAAYLKLKEQAGL